jgi:hypothetical protein
MDCLSSNFEYIVNDFVAEYHGNISICRPAGAATDTDYEDCLAQISAIPRYSAACGPNQPLAENSLNYKWKYHFIIAIVPETQRKYIGPETTPDGKGSLKCFDIIECPDQFPQASTYQQLLDGTAQTLREPIGSSYDPVYAAA